MPEYTDAQFKAIYGVDRNPPPPPPFAKAEQPWSSKELSSYPAARALVDAINTRMFDFGRADMSVNPPLSAQRPMGGGVIPGDDEKTQGPQESTSSPDGPPVGIFVPAFYQVAPPSRTGPDGTVYYFLHMRFRNGAIINVGLFLDKLSRYPLSQSYAVRYLAAQIESSGTAGTAPSQILDVAPMASTTTTTSQLGS